MNKEWDKGERERMKEKERKFWVKNHCETLCQEANDDDDDDDDDEE